MKVAAARLLLESLRPGGAVYNRLVVFFAIVEYVIAIFYRILWNIILCAIRHYLWFTYLPTWSMHEDHVDAKDGRSDDVDDEDDVDHLDLQCVSWLSFIEYYAVWSML